MKIKIVYQLKKQDKKDTLKSLYAPFEGRKIVLDALESKIFLIKVEGTGFPAKVFDFDSKKFIKKIKNASGKALRTGITLTNNEIKDILKVIKFLENIGILLKGTTRKIVSQEGGF